MITQLIAASFVLPLAGMFAAPLFRKSERDTLMTYVPFALGGLAALSVSLLSFLAPEAGALPSLPAFFYGIVGTGTFLASLYAISYLPRYRATYRLSWLAAAYGAFIMGMQAVLLAPSVLAFLLAWEVMSIAAYFLVIADGTHDSLHAGVVYLIMTQVGFLAIASGFLVIAGGQPFATWSDVVANAATLPSWELGTAFVLFMIGFGSKAGLVPLHQWLPYAHPQAPSHASALLSGVMLKIALFGFIETVSLFPSVPLALVILLIVAGLVSAFFGALHAAVENDMKRLLAWSSIENMGLIFSAVGILLALALVPSFPLSSAIATGVTVFAILHTINHFLFKTSLFLAAGTIVSQTHTRELDALGGLAQRWPFFSGVVLALALGAAALPPLGTFFGEWAYVQSLWVGFAAPLTIAAGAVIALAFVAIASGFAIFAFVKFFSVAFLGRPRHEHPVTEKLPVLLVLPSTLGAFALFLTGPVMIPLIVAQGHAWSADLSLVPGAATNALTVLMLLAFSLALAYIIRRLVRPTLAVRVTGTWDCGTPLTPRMQETATGFAAPIRFFFRTLVLSKKTLVSTPVVATNPWITAKRLSWSTGSFWEHWLYRPLVAVVLKAAHGMKRLQNGVVQFYLLLMLIALAAVLIFAL